MLDINLFLLQFSAWLSDGGSTSKISPVNATITVTVIRNDYTPQFQNLPYSGSLDENNQQSGFVIFQATATDNDPSVSNINSRSIDLTVSIKG